MTVASSNGRAWRFPVWFCAAVAINLLAFWLPRTMHRSAVAAGAAFDVAVTVPALYFWLVVSAGLQPRASLIPLCLVGLLRATYVAPGMLWARPALAGAAELAVIGYLVVRLRRGRSNTAPGGDLLERLTLAAREVVPIPAVAEIVASEIAMFWYAFGPPGRKPPIPAGAQAFTVHEKSATAMLFGVFAGLSVAEAAVVHVVLLHWSRTAAWALTGLSTWGAVWLVAAARSLALRPILLGNGELLIRSGMLSTLRVPLPKIAAVRTANFGEGRVVPPMSDPNVLLEFSEPMVMCGMYGIRRRVARIALAVDDPTGLVRALGAGRTPRVSSPAGPAAPAH